MRTLLFTGKGGVGKTTAAGTAVRAAGAGLRTLVLSTDAAHSLADAFGEPVGPDALGAFAMAAYDGDDPLAAPVGDGPMTLRRTRGGTTLRLALPFVATPDIDLARRGDELVVTVGGHRRLVCLPAALARQVVAGARVEKGALEVRFHRLGEGSA